ncbi:AraC family transcriptional regulator [Variovorax sp. LARHSF232]
MHASENGFVGSYGGDLDAPIHSMLGLGPLFAEMADQGVAPDVLLQGTGLLPAQLVDPQAHMSHRQKITIFRNVLRLSRVPDVALRAGSRQRLSDFGVFGYALVSSATFGEAIRLGMKHVRLAGPVLEKRWRIEGDIGIFEGHDVLALGEVLPLATEFWFASIHKLCTCVLEAPMPTRRLLLPYARPSYAESYEQTFGCAVQFDAGVMELHFDASRFDQPSPNANPITADTCARFCERMLAAMPDETALSREIRVACLNSPGDLPTAEAMAKRLGHSVRTLHRRLADESTTYQEIVDQVRRSLAIEYLQGTAMTVEEIAERVGFSEASNFRKAFKRWTGQPPGHFRPSN